MHAQRKLYTIRLECAHSTATSRQIFTLRTGFIPLLPQSAPSRPKVLPFAQTNWGQFGAACPKPARNPKVSQSGPKCALVPKVLPLAQTKRGQFGAAAEPNLPEFPKCPKVGPSAPKRSHSTAWG
jgi:hypothetical protein